MNFESYRAQITAIDLAHITLILIVVLIQIWFGVRYHETGDRWYAAMISVFTVTTLGLVVRLDTFIKRLGGWLAKRGDPWEEALANHYPTKYLTPGADVLTFAIVIVLLVYSQVEAGPYFSNTPLKSWHIFSPRTWYRIGTLGGVAAGVTWWILAATKARTGF